VRIVGRDGGPRSAIPEKPKNALPISDHYQEEGERLLGGNGYFSQSLR
jgi:hypothetical protein